MARGRQARSPAQVPGSGWKDIALRVKDEIAADHVGLIAAGVAFYGLLALFPAITACMAIAALLTEPQAIVDQLERFAGAMPEEAAAIVIGQATSVAGSHEGGLGLAAALGIGLAIISAGKGMGSLIEGMNIAYDETDERGFVKSALVKYGFTLFLVVGFLVGIGISTVIPAILSAVDLGATTEWLARAGSWGALLLMTILGLAVLYRYGPDRANAEWRWITPGATLATLLWLAGSIAFAFYVSNFGSYNETFGTLGGVVVLLMWLWLSAYIILLGAEINAEMEAQTEVDSTTGPEQPMGERGATKADVLGETHG